MLYQHQNTGVVAELIERGPVTVKLKVQETGEVKEIGSATFKRWWKQVEAEDSGFSEEENTAELFEAADFKISEEELPDVLEGEPIKIGDFMDDPTGSQNDLEPSEEADYEPDNKEATAETVELPDENQPVMALSEIVSKLENCFDLLNDLYFCGALTRPVITVQSTPRAYGHCSTKKIWNSGSEDIEGYYEINIGAEHLNRPSENTAATMCHEMIHLYCRENDLSETCQNGRYHNKFFKQEAEKRDLKIDYDRAIGYSITAPTEVFTTKLREAGYALEVPFARHTLGNGKSTSSRTKAHKYVCPNCGQEVRTTSELNLICGICNVHMERAD